MAPVQQQPHRVLMHPNPTTERSAMNDHNPETEANNAAKTTVGVLHHALDEAGTLAQRGGDALRSTTHDVQARVQRVSQQTTDYVQHEPMKALLMAAATGAVLMALVGLMTRSRGRA
jgi:ElaB/YqjD/DUF883 family membrane-anchored ribosome-binding protein